MTSKSKSRSEVIAVRVDEDLKATIDDLVQQGFRGMTSASSICEFLIKRGLDHMLDES